MTPQDQSYSRKSYASSSDVISSTPATSQQELEPHSLWNLPGVDKETFYAAALYLHAAAKGQLRDPSEHVSRHETKTDDKAREFLDRLADCFARSKSEDPSSHVTATAMVIKDAPQKTITVYVAKNHSEKGIAPGVSENHWRPGENPNIVFGDRLFAWFNSLADGQSPHTSEIRATLYKFNQSRLEYYIKKIAEIDLDGTDRPAQDAAILAVTQIVERCKVYQEAYLSFDGHRNDITGDRLSELEKCAQSAADMRSNRTYRYLNHIAYSLSKDDSFAEADIDLTQLVKWVYYLGRLGAAYNTFRDFCTAKEHHGYFYQYKFLSSPKEEEWPTNTYKSKLESWTGEFGLDDERQEDQTARTIVDDFATKAGRRGTARVHCEIQLLEHFTRPGAETCLDYFGCSKKSCWLCWKLIGHYGKYTTKESHRMIYPMWAFPSGVSPSRLEMARALMATYNDMLYLIQDKILSGKDFSSRINISHTSARLTPRDLEMRTSAISSSLPLLTSELLPGKDRVPFRSVTVLHLPATTDDVELSTPRLISMDLFEADDSDPWERLMTECYIGERRFIFACQLNTKPERRELSLQEFQSGFWNTSYMAKPSNVNEFALGLLYRTEDDDLRANPWLLNHVNTINHHRIEQDMIPWRGDTFVFAVTGSHYHYRPKYYPQLCLNSDSISINKFITQLQDQLSVFTIDYINQDKFRLLEDDKERFLVYNVLVN